MDRDGKNRHRNEQGNGSGNEQKNRRETGRKKGRMKELGAALSMELREHRSSFIVYFTLRILVIATLVLQLLNRNYENVFLCALTLLLLVMPSLVSPSGTRSCIRSTGSWRRRSDFPLWIS